MGRSGRLFSLLRPYTFLFVANSVATLVASVMDGATFVLLIPFLRTLFGQQAIPVGGGSSVERVLAAVAGPLLAAGSPEGALRNVVAVLLGTLVLKNALSYAAAVWSIAIQEGVVRDLRVQLFEHLQVLPLGFFQRTRGGQLLARVISDTDQVKTTVTAALASLLQNISLIVVYVAILVGLSWRLTLIALVCAPLLVLIIRPLVGKVRGQLPPGHGRRRRRRGPRVRGAGPGGGRGRPPRRAARPLRRAHRVPRRVVLVRRPGAGAPGRGLRGVPRPGGGDRGAVRGGEDHARGPAAALLRAHGRGHPHGRHAHHAVHAAQPARADGDRVAGNDPLERHRVREHRLRTERLLACPGRGRGAGGGA